MRIRELLEAQPWGGFKGSISNRIWFNTNTGEAITTNDDGNHSVGVSNNPELFGLTVDELTQHGLQPGEKAYDYDGRVLFAAMNKGWVRIYIDARSPDTNSNAEGISFGALRRGLIWYCEQVGTPMRFVLVLRHSAGDKDGTRYPLSDDEQIEWFIRHGTLKRERINQDQPVQVRTMNTTPHSFRKV